MKVFRVEDSDGFGPYHDKYHNLWDARDHNDEALYPATYRDFDRWFEENERHAFPCLATFAAWFSEYHRKELDYLRLSLAIYEIDKGVEFGASGKQVLFPVESAVLIKKLNLIDLTPVPNPL